MRTQNMSADRILTMSFPENNHVQFENPQIRPYLPQKASNRPESIRNGISCFAIESRTENRDTTYIVYRYKQPDEFKKKEQNEVR